MLKSRLRKVAEKLDANVFKCEFASRCNLFQDGGETCTKAADKKHCGKYRDFLRDNL